MPRKKLKFQRVLLKLSGEALMGNKKFGIDQQVVHFIANELEEISRYDVQIAIVIGGGNIFRGLEASAEGMERTSADYMGMLATALNALALQNALEKQGMPTRVLSAIEMRELAEPYIRRRAVRHLEKGRIVIFACGTGNPYFTTDTAASLRAVEINAEIILKATKVDGVYSGDPVKNRRAKKFDEITFMEVLRKGLKVMDSTAISLCMDNNLNIVVFSLMTRGNIRKVLEGRKIGTLVRGGGSDAKRSKKKTVR